MIDNLPSIEKVSVTRMTAINLMPAKFREKFETIDPVVLDMSEMDLEEHFNRTPNDYALRRRLWELVPQAQMEGRKLTVDEWSLGIVDPSYIHTKLIHNPFRLAWLFTPLQTHFARYEELFDVLFNKFRKKVKEMDINDDNFAATVKLLENLTNRVMGAVPKNINLKAAHVHADARSSAPVNREEVDKRLQELESMKNAVPVIDVDPE